MPDAPLRSPAPIQPIDLEGLHRSVRAARPVPHFVIDSFLEDGFARAVCDALPSFEQARRAGKLFHTVNERNKVQLCDARAFPEPVRRLNEALAEPAFLELLSDVFGIPKLLADEQLVGGGVHETGPCGRLDVHVDFNQLQERGLHRRLNLLLYLNRDWREDWGGRFELWDAEVRVRHVSLLPLFNRCVVFETSEISFHGVTAVTCPSGETRKSFAAYYYTREPPPGWDGRFHSTVFRARPDEHLKGSVLMPAEKLLHGLKRTARSAKRKLRRPPSS